MALLLLNSSAHGSATPQLLITWRQTSGVVRRQACDVVRRQACDVVRRQACD